jgi:transposase
MDFRTTVAAARDKGMQTAEAAETFGRCGSWVRRLVEAAGCRLLLLPPYSPHYNPIENAISKVKALRRKLAR